VDGRVFGVLLLQGGEELVEVVLRGQRRAAPALVEQGVVDVFADVEVTLQLVFLPSAWVQPVPEHPVHCQRIDH